MKLQMTVGGEKQFLNSIIRKGYFAGRLRMDSGSGGTSSGQCDPPRERTDISSCPQLGSIYLVPRCLRVMVTFKSHVLLHTILIREAYERRVKFRGNTMSL